MKQTLLIVIAAVFFACSEKVTEVEIDKVEGTYILKTVNGSVLPYTVLQDGSSGVIIKMQVSAGSVIITATGSATVSTTLQMVVNGVISQTQTETEQREFKLDGTKWSYNNNLGVTGSVSGGTLTIVDKTAGSPELTLVYNR